MTLDRPLTRFDKHEINRLACILGEIERHLVEDTNILGELDSLGIDLSKEKDGYNSLIESLCDLSKFTAIAIELV